MTKKKTTKNLTYNKDAFVAYGRYCINNGHRPRGKDPVAIGYYSALAYIKKQVAQGFKIPDSLQKTIDRWKEYPTATEKNGIVRTPRIFLDHINAAIDFCKTNGYRPHHTSDVGRKIMELNSFISLVKNGKKPANPKLMTAFEKLQDIYAQYPTLAAYNAIAKEEEIKAQATEQKRIQFKTPYRDLVRVVAGEHWLDWMEKLNNGRDINWTIVDAAIRVSLDMLNERERDILIRFLGIGENFIKLPFVTAAQRCENPWIPYVIAIQPKERTDAGREWLLKRHITELEYDDDAKEEARALINSPEFAEAFANMDEIMFDTDKSNICDLEGIGTEFQLTRERTRQIKEKAVKHIRLFLDRHNIYGLIGTEVASNMMPEEIFKLKREYIFKETGRFDRLKYASYFDVTLQLADYVKLGIIKQAGKENDTHPTAMLADRDAYSRRGLGGLLYSMQEDNFYQYDIGKILQGRVKIYSAASDIRTLANKSMSNAISANGKPGMDPEKLRIVQQYSEDFLDLARKFQSIVFEVTEDVFVRETASADRVNNTNPNTPSDTASRFQNADEIKPIGDGKYIGLYLPNDTVVLEPNGNFGRSTWVIHVNDKTRAMIDELEHHYTIKDRLNNQDAFSVRHLQCNGQYNYDISHIRDIVTAVTLDKTELFDKRNLLLGTNSNMVSNDVISKIIGDKTR